MKDNSLVSKIIILEIIVIGYLLLNLASDLNTTGVFVQIIPLNKSHFTQLEINEIKYFVEPIPNSDMVMKSEYYGVEYAIQTINNDSLFERYNYTVEKPDDTYRIIALGDSFTQGLWVNNSDAYPEVLEDMLNETSKNCSSYKKFEIINLGVGRYDVLYDTIRFEKRGLKYNPNLVIWLVRDGHFSRVTELWDNFTKNMEFPDMYIDRENFDIKWNDAFMAYNDWIDTIGRNEVKNKYILSPIAKFLNLTENNDISVVIFSLSGYNDEMQKDLNEVKSEHKNLRITDLNINPDYYINNLSVFYDKESGIYDFHPNEKGHKLIASKLYEYLKADLLENC